MHPGEVGAQFGAEQIRFAVVSASPKGDGHFLRPGPEAGIDSGGESPGGALGLPPSSVRVRCHCDLPVVVALVVVADRYEPQFQVGCIREAQTPRQRPILVIGRETQR